MVIIWSDVFNDMEEEEDESNLSSLFDSLLNSSDAIFNNVIICPKKFIHKFMLMFFFKELEKNIYG
jgi:hypothetical protein